MRFYGRDIFLISESSISDTSCDTPLLPLAWPNVMEGRQVQSVQPSQIALLEPHRGLGSVEQWDGADWRALATISITFHGLAFMAVIDLPLTTKMGRSLVGPYSPSSLKDTLYRWI